MNFLKKQWAAFCGEQSSLEGIFRLILGLVFTLAAFSKGIAPNKFINVFAQLDVVPITWVEPLAYPLMIGELALAICFFNGRLYYGALLGATLLFPAFAAVIIKATSQGTFLNCGCLGPLSDDNPYTALAKDAAFFAVCVYLWIKAYRRYAAKTQK